MAFKANIDDLRESPALDISIEIATRHPGQTYLVEPNINKTPDQFLSTNAVLVNAEDAIRSADILILLVDHDEFKKAHLKITGKIILDSRGIWK